MFCCVATITYTELQLVSRGYSVDGEPGHAVRRSEALHRTGLNHNWYTSCRTAVRVQDLHLHTHTHTHITSESSVSENLL